MSKPLSDLRVIDLGRIVSAPWCTQILADLGAEVIKIERPERGDELRHYGPSFLKDSDGNPTQESAHYITVNRNKKSITVNIATPEGQDIIRRLVRVSDALVENYKVGDLARYGLDYESLSKENEGLIYCSLTGFGQTGPYAKRPGLDAAFQGMCGMMAVTGEPDGPPQRVGVFVIDEMTGVYASTAILAALRHREMQGGKGQYIDMALLDVGVAAMAARTMEYLIDGMIPERLGTKSPGSAPAQVFKCKDGYLNVQAGGEADYRRLCDAVGLPDLKEDPRFVTRMDRVRHQDLLASLLEEQFLKRPVKEWFEALMACNVIVAPIYRANEMVADKQIRHRNLHFNVPHPVAGEAPMVASPLRLSETPVDEYRAPPTLGQHTDNILTDLLGFSAREVAELRCVGAI